MRRTSKSVDAYISGAPREVQPKLREMRSMIRKTAPTAVESISYGIPFYDYMGRLAWFGLSKSHIGLYLRPPVIAAHRKDLEGYETTKSAVHFPIDRELPARLIRQLIKARMAMNEAGE